ncbi:MAG: NepR family anti-sigma factor [Xanthobacteraceae bacterium]
MHTEAPERKTGRLTRDDQRKLGDILKRVYDDVVRQGVPDRFRTLLDEIEGAHGRQQTGSGTPPELGREAAAAPSRMQTEHGGPKDQFNKGSH